MSGKGSIHLVGAVLGAAVGVLAALGLRLALVPAASSSTAPAQWERATAAPEERRSPEPVPARSDAGERREAVEAPAAEVGAASLGVVGHGRLLSLDGEPVASARTLFEDADARTLEANAGPGGSWTLGGLHAGAYEVRIDAGGFLPFHTPVTVPAAADWRHDFVLEPGISYPVRFEDPSGEAFETESYDAPGRYLAAVATLERPGRRLLGVRSRELERYGEGRYVARRPHYQPLPTLGPRYQGLLELRARPSLWVSAAFRDVVLESRPLNGAEEELVFVVDPAELGALRGEVRVRFVDRETREPITEGVQLGHPSGGLRAKPEEQGGTLVFTDVAPGRLELELGQLGGRWESFSREVDVPPGASVDLGTIAVGLPESFVVRVVDEERSPLPLRVEALRLELVGGPRDLRGGVSAEAGADGRATMTRLAPGLTRVSTGGRDGWARVSRLVDTREQQELELVVPKGVEVVFPYHEEDVRPECTYLLEDAEGIFLTGGWYLPPRIWLTPGSYVVRVLDDERELEQRTIVVESERLVVRLGGER